MTSFDSTVKLTRLNVGEFERFLNNRFHGDGFEFGVGFLCEAANALNDAAGALRLIFNAGVALGSRSLESVPLAASSLRHWR